MIRRILSLFKRFATAHLDVTTTGPVLSGPSGERMGNVDVVALTGNRLRVAGWALAPQLSVTSGDVSVSVQPNLVREDVREALGVHPAVGFDVQLPAASGEAVLCVPLPNADPIRVHLEIKGSFIVYAKLWMKFIGTSLYALPILIRWRTTGDAQVRAKIKTLLGLDTFTHAAPMDSRIFSNAENTIVPMPTGSVTIIVPVYNAFEILSEVLDRVVENTDVPWRLLIIEDCSSDTRIRPFLREWVASQNSTKQKTNPFCKGDIVLIENDQNIGFINSVNKALAQPRNPDEHVIILNSDALVPKGWASRLIRPFLAIDNVASVTPMSNDAEIFSVPVICGRTELEPAMADAIDTVARGFNPVCSTTVVPTGVGFCMAMSAKYLRRLPLFDTAFGSGYGEEVDWCQKARAMGGRHIGLAGLFVEHRGGASFGSERKKAILLKNNSIITSRYPKYDAEVQGFIASDPLLTARVALAAAWAGSWSKHHEVPIPIFLAHSLGGGADKYLEKRITDDYLANAVPALILRVGGKQRWQIEIRTHLGSVSGTTDDFDFVKRLLDPIAQRRIVYSCGVGDTDPITLPGHLLDLKGKQGKIEVLFHDYFPISPSYTMLDSDGVYRGTVTQDRDESPKGEVHKAVRPDGSKAGLSNWQNAWHRLLVAADEVVVFSEDSKKHVLAAYPDIQSRLMVRPHQLLVSVKPIDRPKENRRVIGVLGNIGRQKGAEVVRDLARLIDGRNDIKLVVVGNIDIAFTLPPEVPVHGDYLVEDLPALVARYGITEWLIPSIWPETFSYTTHEALATGMPVYAFRIGAQGDAVTSAKNGKPIDFSPDSGLANNVIRALI